MKKIIICALAITLLMCACTGEPAPKQSPESTATESPTKAPTAKATQSPEPTPEPEPYALSCKDISIEDGLITMQVPQSLTEAENYTGCLYLGYGTVKNTAGDDVYLHVTVSSVYQAEEPELTCEMMDQLIDKIMIYPHGKDIIITRIGDIEKENGAKGYQSKCVLYDGSEFNYINLAGNGRFYSIKVYTQNNSVPESEIYKILDSVKIDAEKEKSSVESFELNVDGTTYYSSKLEGASIEMPENWNPSESFAFTYDNSVLGIVSGDNLGTINARKYDKQLTDIDSLNKFYSIMMVEVANRGFITSDQMTDVKNYIDQSGRNFTVYPTKFFLVQYLLEYDDAFYCLEGTYLGSEQSGVDIIMTAIGTFTAPGEEILGQ